MSYEGYKLVRLTAKIFFPGEYELGRYAAAGLPHVEQEVGMLISTMNDIPGYEITEVLGEVFGLTVRSRNVGSQFGAALKSLAGGELKGMTKNLIDSRHEVIGRMTDEAEAKGFHEPSLREILPQSSLAQGMSRGDESRA